MAGACQAFNLKYDEAIDLLTDGIPDEILGGAIYYAATSGRSFLDMLKRGNKRPLSVTKNLGNGREFHGSVASTAEHLMSMGGLKGLPENLDELISAGLDVVGVRIGN